MKKIAGILILCSPWYCRHNRTLLRSFGKPTRSSPVPESVISSYEPLLNMSLIDGGSWDADGKGGIGTLNPDGTHYNGSWVTGLDAPKGLGNLW